MSTAHTLTDMHQLAVPTEYVKALAKIGVGGSGADAWPEWSVEQTLGLMERKGISAVINSIASPGIYFGDQTFTNRRARQINEVMAALTADHPSQFGALGVVPLPGAGAAAAEAEAAYALDSLKLDGLTLLGHMGGKYLGYPDYNELYAELDRRAAVVLVHPVRPAVRDMPEYCYPQDIVELVTDTPRAIGSMLFSGMLEAYPNIRFIMSHAGGTVLLVLSRLRNYAASVPKAQEAVPQGVDAYLKRLYYDVAQAALPTTLGILTDYVPASQILFGSDYPFARLGPDALLAQTMDGVRGFGFDGESLRLIERDNALKLFPRLNRSS